MCCRAFVAVLRQLGFPERLAITVTLALAETLAHPFTVAIALWAAGILHQLLRDPIATTEIGQQLIEYWARTSAALVPFGRSFAVTGRGSSGQLEEALGK